MHKSIETNWIVLHVGGDNIIYVDSFEADHIPKEIKKFISNSISQQMFLEY